MVRRRKISAETAAVLAVFLEDPERERYGLEVGEEAGILSGSLYPILIRQEEREVLVSRPADDNDPPAPGRRRRYYRLTRNGAELAREDIAEWRRHEAKRPVSLRIPRTRTAEG
jgi:PadR family transcriptional regulator, regulatory protein PadR